MMWIRDGNDASASNTRVPLARHLETGRLLVLRTTAKKTVVVYPATTYAYGKELGAARPK